MLLAIDAGNTNIVFALFEGENLRGQWRISTDKRRTADEYGVWLSQLIDVACVDAAILASVVPQVLFELKTLCRHYFRCELMVIGEAGVRTGITAHIDRPQEVGADRLVNAYAAWLRYRQPLIVVDFGTATTFDVVDAEGNYIGGAIAPGVNLSLEALRLAAARLPDVNIAAPERVIGRNTVDAMQSGIYFGYVGLIEGIVERIRQEYGKPMKVVATGGLAPLYAKAAAVIDALEPDLTLHGLHAMHALNTQP